MENKKSPIITIVIVIIVLVAIYFIVNSYQQPVGGPIPPEPEQCTGTPIAVCNFFNDNSFLCNSIEACNFDSGANRCFGIISDCELQSVTYCEEIPGCDPTTATYTLTVTKSGTGSGTVNSYFVGIDCGNDCTESYYANTQTTLIATASSGSIFTGWSGACSGTQTFCDVTMSQDKIVTATFSRLGKYQ